MLFNLHIFTGKPSKFARFAFPTGRPRWCVWGEIKPRGEQGAEENTQTEMEPEDEKHQDPELAESSIEEKKDRCEIRFLCASFPLRRLPTRASLFGALGAASRSRSCCLPVVPHHRRSFVHLTCYRKMLLQDFCQAYVFRYWAANRGPSGTPLSGVYAPYHSLRGAFAYFFAARESTHHGC